MGFSGVLTGNVMTTLISTSRRQLQDNLTDNPGWCSSLVHFCSSLQIYMPRNCTPIMIISVHSPGLALLRKLIRISVILIYWYVWLSDLRKVSCDFYKQATVLLSTSVSVLAINSIDNVGVDGFRSAVQITIYISIILSVGSISVGLALFQQYRASGADTPLRAVGPKSCFWSLSYWPLHR